jgi:hypothetical protein
MLPASPVSQRTTNEVEAPPATEPSRPTEPRCSPAPAREPLATLDDEDFDFHDTIPAPPWLGDADASDEPSQPSS